VSLRPALEKLEQFERDDDDVDRAVLAAEHLDAHRLDVAVAPDGVRASVRAPRLVV
jgi:hypothetical protein